MEKQKEVDIVNEDITATMKFLKQTKEGVFTEVPPIVLEISRIDEQREPDVLEEEYNFSYSD